MKTKVIRQGLIAVILGLEPKQTVIITSQDVPIAILSEQEKQILVHKGLNNGDHLENFRYWLSREVYHWYMTGNIDVFPYEIKKVSPEYLDKLTMPSALLHFDNNS